MLTSCAPETSPLTIATIRRHLSANGGLTVDPASGTMPTSGFAVCPNRRLSRVVPWPIPVHGWVLQWVEHLQHHLEADHYLGAWLDRPSRHAWVEAVIVLPRSRRDHAVSVARSSGQRAMYDLDRRRAVWLTTP